LRQSFIKHLPARFPPPRRPPPKPKGSNNSSPKVLASSEGAQTSGPCLHQTWAAGPQSDLRITAPYSQPPEWQAAAEYEERSGQARHTWLLPCRFTLSRSSLHDRWQEAVEFNHVKPYKILLCSQHPATVSGFAKAPPVSTSSPAVILFQCTKCSTCTTTQIQYTVYTIVKAEASWNHTKKSSGTVGSM
jgi:hypothetical protein